MRSGSCGRKRDKEAGALRWTSADPEFYRAGSKIGSQCSEVPGGGRPDGCFCIIGKGKSMIETKQLQYLVVCADLQSFSKAADVLFTSQPNVSKIIRTLEEELGFSLFERQNRGIRLTKRGEQVYEYACRALENIDQLAAFASMDEGEELSIACNPSSWMSACFTEFYQIHKDEHVRFQIMTASTEDVIRRCGSGRSDVGFVHMMEPQMLAFQYKLEKNHLKFVELRRLKAMLYYGMQNPVGRKISAEEVPMEDIRLVQCYEDEFTLNHYWDIFRNEQDRGQKARVAVITNSDYVMNDLLRNTDLGNISGAYLGPEEESRGYLGRSLYGEKEPVLFGYVVRKEETPGPWTERFLDFIKAKLQ